MSKKIAKHLETGCRGENLAKEYLKKNGYNILATNYRKISGEIDIIASKKESQWEEKLSIRKLISYCFKNKEEIIFVEIKTSRKKSMQCEKFPEENVHRQKRKRLIKAANFYLAENNFPPETPWRIDVISLILDENNNTLDLKHFKNAVWEE